MRIGDILKLDPVKVNNILQFSTHSNYHIYKINEKLAITYFLQSQI